MLKLPNIETAKYFEDACARCSHDLDDAHSQVNLKLKPGDTQYFFFRESDPPPWYKPDAPKYDRPTSKHDKAGNPIIDEGYVDKPKGMKQVLWERGLWKEGTVRS